MKQTRQTLPGAWICTNDPSLNHLNHGRKSILHNKIYLKDFEEFEIELYNPLTENVLAVIYLDGKPISKSGIVVRAGQRFYLDCFYDDKKKFVFRTYDVENTSQNQEAISKNGLFEVQFFKEKILKKYNADQIVHHHHHHHHDWYHYRPYWNGWYNGFYYVNGNISTPTLTLSGSTGTLYSNSNSTVTLNNSNLNGSLTANCSDYNSTYTSTTLSDKLYSTNSSGLGSMSMTSINSTSQQINDSLNFASLNNKIETGQVDKGAESKQNFTEVQMDFEDSILNKICYQLLPESRKPAEFSISNSGLQAKKVIIDGELEINGDVKINGQKIQTTKEKSTNKVSQLLELKAMLDEKLITEKEFEYLKLEIMSLH